MFTVGESSRWPRCHCLMTKVLRPLALSRQSACLVGDVTHPLGIDYAVELSYATIDKSLGVSVTASRATGKANLVRFPEDIVRIVNCADQMILISIPDSLWSTYGLQHFCR
jgi:hypothetical protein